MESLLESLEFTLLFPSVTQDSSQTVGKDLGWGTGLTVYRVDDRNGEGFRTPPERRRRVHPLSPSVRRDGWSLVYVTGPPVSHKDIDLSSLPYPTYVPVLPLLFLVWKRATV